jgi:predicted aconitase
MTEYGDHLAWAESSAVAYANSVIGARTNREGGPSALAAAIVGRTPCYGLHLVKNRSPELVIPVGGVPAGADESWFGALGYLAGKIAGNRIPLFTGIRPSRDQLKNLGAAMAATGATALYHVQDITPETRIFRYDPTGLETVPITAEEVADVYTVAEPDAVAIGCPHCSEEELSRIAQHLKGCTVKKPLYIFAARDVISRSADSVRIIEKSGAGGYAETCMVVSPALEQYRTIMVSSGKALSYVPNMCGAAAILGTLEQCLQSACT